MKRCDPVVQVLLAVFQLSQDTEAVDIFSISERTGLSLYSVLAVVDRLNSAELLDSRRLRLTLPGLMVASSLNRRRGQRREVAELLARAA